MTCGLHSLNTQTLRKSHGARRQYATFRGVFGRQMHGDKEFPSAAQPAKAGSVGMAPECQAGSVILLTLQSLLRPCVLTLQSLLRPCVLRLQSLLRPCVLRLQSLLRPCVIRLQSVLRPCVLRLQSLLRPYVLRLQSLLRPRVLIRDEGDVDVAQKKNADVAQKFALLRY